MNSMRTTVQLFHPRRGNNFSINIAAPHWTEKVAQLVTKTQGVSLPISALSASASALAFD
jgi:hypothetical protein